jgi:nucleoside-diphosphate-sugar epimerase
VIFTGAVYADA